VLASWVALQKSAKGTKERDAAKRGLWLYCGILLVLLAFSCYNQLEYLSATWTPPNTALTLPAPWPFLLRALVTPALFMLAAFLAPLAETLAQSISNEARYLTRLTLESARRQWRARLQEMEARREDVTAALVNLVEDAQERRAINTIHHALYGGDAPAYDLVPMHTGIPLPALRTPNPTGPGTPNGAEPDTSDHTYVNGKVVQLPRANTRVRTTARKRRPKGGVRTVDSYEPQVRAAWAGGATSIAKMRAAVPGMSQSAASGWVRTLKAEAALQAQQPEEDERAAVAL
jgi:hypothetical protein